jgi:hypothetical protein
MSESSIYLTVEREKRQPENDGYIAVISQGQPQLGDRDITVLDVEVVKNMKEAKAWFKRMKVEQPWVQRS